MSHSLYRQFADNLMTYSMRAGSIAEVCRQTNINRQQFNKYLAGNSLPAPETLAKLTEFFRVSEIELFTGVSPQAMAKRAENRHLTLPAWGDPAKYKSLEPGIYSVIGPWKASQVRIFRGTIVLKNGTGNSSASQRFTRFLRVANSRKLPFYPYRSRIDGTVLQSGAMLSMMAYAQQEPEDMMATYSFNTTNRIADGMWPGLVMTFFPTGLPATMRVLLIREPEGTSLRQSLRQNGIFEADEPSLPPEVSTYIIGDNERSPRAIYCHDALHMWRQM